MNLRIKTLRKHLGLSQDEFGSKLFLKKAAISMLESGKSSPTNQTINLICREYGASEKWLRTGEGEMFEPAPHDLVDEVAAQYGLSPEYAAMIRQLVQLPESVQQQLVGIAFEIAGVKPSETEPPYQRDARLLREEADAVEQEGERSSASPLQKDA